jgi:hypothetical protein
MLNDKCKNRLYNYKFEQALMYLDDSATEVEHDLVMSLASTFGNPGLMGGRMGDVVAASLRSIGITDE